ncbi:HAD family hydrolase [Stenotrophomonas sp. C960]|uniref:D-glycero-alpha-D-manno-heptose-1,7-bisphosphate 7-phosphatase n=1 Tax=Stenotrophomonas TaxID=40323 RepID=UPI000D6DE577|nr:MULTISPECIES: HAD family hydrolase [Stenotrophomonas]MBN4971732.1 HAD family hydrolase [Stenotrophomonas maltophilia]MDV3465509.1 HAD family hydrolase [Stenotrophomonas sp. C960]MDV3530571.1 HAD family hydrolase [Stenotrophomonas sp. C2866]PWQ84905.1 D,D-heptose 1,7-bisphosphate phosphatase [Stenotrophomonas maltophilia]
MTVLPNVPGFVAGPIARRPGAPVLFLDRDGVINVNHGYVHTAERTEWVPGILPLLADAARLGYQVVVVTNQAGIARGFYSVDDFTDYTHWQHEQLLQAGAPLLGTWFCPHHPQAGQGEFKIDCLCRKPEPGMLLKAIEGFSIDPAQAVFVGDKISDMQAGAAAGIGKLFLIAGDIGKGAAPQQAIMVPDLAAVQRQL